MDRLYEDTYGSQMINKDNMTSNEGIEENSNETPQEQAMIDNQIVE